MSNEQQPRSVRLTKEHREDMARAVIKKWERDNPPPQQDTPYEKAELVCKLLASKDKNVKQSFIERTRAIQTALASLKHSEKKHVSVQREADVLVHFKNNDGTELGKVQTRIPKYLADTYQLPHVDVYKSCPQGFYSIRGQDGVDDDAVEFVRFAEGERYCNVVVPISYREQFDALTEKEEARKQWVEKRDQFQSEVRDLLDTFNTTKQIRESWPEMADYMPPHIADPEKAVQLPALEISRLNQRLGLK